MTASSAPARSSSRLLFRLAVIVASVVAAIVGSVLLLTHRSSEKVPARTSSSLPPGGKVVARIRIGHANEALGKEGGGALAVGEGGVWAMSNDQGMLMRIDPARDAIVARIKVDAPEAVAAGDGAVWLSNPSYNTVTRVDPATNTVAATIPVGSLPEGIAVSRGAVWVVNAGVPSVSRIDPATNRVVKTIRIGSKNDCCAVHTMLVASPRAVWVALTNGDRIVRVDPATNTVVATVRLSYQPCGFITAGQTGVWSTSFCGDDVLARVDPRTDKVTTRLAEPAPSDVELAFGSVWVANGGTGDIDQIGPHSGRRVARLNVGGEPDWLGIGFGSVWVNDAFGRVLRIKPQR